ncbi:MAG: response regulator transcription factor [Myxococcota bacterium]
MSEPLRVAIVEDDDRFRRALQSVLSATDDITVCGTFATAEALWAALRDPEARAGLWDVLIMDLGLPGASGVEGIREVTRRFPSVRVLVCSVFQDPSTIVEALQAGASGYCVKGCSSEELLDRIRTVAAGGPSLDPVATGALVDMVRRGVTPRASAALPDRTPLTPREQDVLRCLSQGESYEQTAVELGISLHTVRTHIRGIYRKLDARNVAEAVARALRERLL